LAGYFFCKGISEYEFGHPFAGTLLAIWSIVTGAIWLISHAAGQAAQSAF